MGKPKIRFEGYSEDWEQRKLGEVCEIKDSARIPNSEWSESGIPYIRASDVTNENTDGVLFISQERYEFYKNRTGAPTKNDVLFNGGGEIGKSLLITDEKPIYVQGGAVLYARTSKSRELVGQYLKTYFETTNAKSYIDAASAGGTMRHFTLKPSQKMRILMPSVEEQEKIGGYFVNLDRLITLHQRKYDETKTLKKYMLQKMFPQNGEKVPEIRFDGFTEDWEQRKLDDVLKRRIEQRQQSEEYPRLAFASGQGVIPLSERKTNNREQLTKDEYTKKYLVTELNDIVYNPANVKYGAIDRNKCGRGVISPIYVTFTTNEVPGFIERIVTSHDFQQRALRFEEGTVTKRQSVNPEDLVTLDILVAPKREEQQKIATYFDALDHLITLHQRKCNELKEIKKYMLQNMFV
ncbi:MAG: restriction endonuclease subunit S [Coprococcus comes]